MENKKIRLITAQGPTQLLNVVSILKYEIKDENNQSQNWEDYLVLGGFYIMDSDENLDNCIKTCIEISRHWKFKSVTYLSEKDLAGNNLSFLEVVQSVTRSLSIGLVDKIYVCNNFQPFNEILLGCYNSAVKVCYGDGFGILGIKSSIDKHQSMNPKGYLNINLAYLFIPIEIGINSFSLVDAIVQPPIDYLTSTIYDISSNMLELKTYTKSFIKNSSKNLTLVTLSNFSEGFYVKPKITYKWMSFILFIGLKLRFLRINAFLRMINLVKQKLKSHLAEREAFFYFKQVIRYSKNTELIIIKPHPRETLSQSLLLLSLLSKKGYDSILINQRFSSTPIEFFFHHLNFAKVISFSSFSSLTAKLILDNEKSTIYPFIDSDLRKKYLKNNFGFDQNYQKLWCDLLEQAKIKSFSPMRSIDYQLKPLL